MGSVATLQPLGNQARHLGGTFAMQEMAASFDQFPLVRTLEELLLRLKHSPRRSFEPQSASVGTVIVGLHASLMVARATSALLESNLAVIRKGCRQRT